MHLSTLETELPNQIQLNNALIHVYTLFIITRSKIPECSPANNCHVSCTNKKKKKKMTLFKSQFICNVTWFGQHSKLYTILIMLFCYVVVYKTDNVVDYLCGSDQFLQSEPGDLLGFHIAPTATVIKDLRN